jgi:hypothetical protein
MTGCSSSQSTKPECKTLNYAINIGSGGGVTGIYTGNYIDSNGIVYKWEGIVFNKAEKKAIKKLSAEQICKLNDFFIKNKPDTIIYSKSGNLTDYIILENKDKKISISWVNKFPKDDTPQKILDLKNYILKIINEQ